MRRKTSTYPSSSKMRVSHSRSSGRKPEFLRLPRQFFKIDLLVRDVPVAAQDDFAAFAHESSRCGENAAMKRNFDCCRCSPLEPEGR